MCYVGKNGGKITLKFKKYTADEFYKCNVFLILERRYADYTYYAIKFPHVKNARIYFQNPFDNNFYHIDDCLKVMGNNINPCHDSYLKNVWSKYYKMNFHE